MKLLAIAIPLLAAATAHAQAPGQMPGDAPMGPGGGPSTIEPCTAAATNAIPVMENRWAVGLAIGSLSVAPKDTPDNKTEFAIGELSLRYRATLHLELELAVGGGQQKQTDGTQGDLQVNTGVLGLRYRFAPLDKWNWWLGAGIGGISVTRTGATDQDRKDAQRPLGSFGIGIERRFRQFALHAELRGFGVGQHEASTSDPPKAMPIPAGSQVMNPAPSSPNLSGGVFTLGASYYF